MSGGLGGVPARVARLAIGAIAAALLFEVVLRQVYWLPYEQHPRLGAVLQDGARARYCREGCGTSHWSADGVRRAAAPDPARPSILVLGDSFTEALMTDDERVYTHRLEDLLGRDWQVLNLGRSGASPADYAALAPYYRERFGARWTLVQLRSPDLQIDAWNPEKTHFVRRADGGVDAVEVPPVVSSRNEWLAPLRRRSALLSLAGLRAREFAAAARNEPALFRGAQARGPEAAPPSVFPVEAELEAVAAAHGGRVTFFFIPDFDPRDVSTRDDTERRFVEACASRAMSCVNLRDAFPTFSARRESPYGFANSSFNWGHMNDGGHAAAAELLRDEIERLTARDLL